MNKRRKVTRLKVAIVEQGFTQRSVAKKAGMHETLVSLIANGRWNPDNTQKARIAEALNQPVNEVFPD